MTSTSTTLLLISLLLLPGCFASDPGALHLRVYNETPHNVDLRIGLMQDEELLFNASMTLPGHNQSREGLPPSGEVQADLDAGRYRLWVMVNSSPCMPGGMDDVPEDWDGTVGSINHVVGGIWGVTIMPDLACKIGKVATV